jgi:hypothetical protein
MGDENTRRAAEEYLAAKISEEGQSYDDKLNAEAAISLAPAVWGTIADTINAKCREWNTVTNEQTFTCKETMLGDLRVWCAGRPHHMTVHYDSSKRLVTIKNSARPDHEPDLILSIEGYSTDSGRGARLVRNEQPANIDALILTQLRILAGLDRQAKV